MTKISYNSKNNKIEARIDETLLHLNPVINTLHYIGKKMIKGEHDKNHIQIIHHDNWGLVCPYDLHGVSSMASYRFRKEMPKINPDIVEFASTEIGLGNLPILRFEKDKHYEQILRTLDDIGKTWQYTKNKEEAEKLIKQSGIPLFISTKGLSEKERIEKFRLEYLFIDKDSLIITPLEVYDKAMSNPYSKDRDKFESMNLDNLSLGIGLNLYESGIAPIKLYEE